jgi:hypothetical protein
MFKYFAGAAEDARLSLEATRAANNAAFRP